MGAVRKQLRTTATNQALAYKARKLVSNDCNRFVRSCATANDREHPGIEFALSTNMQKSKIRPDGKIQNPPGRKNPKSARMEKSRIRKILAVVRDNINEPSVPTDSRAPVGGVQCEGQPAPRHSKSRHTQTPGRGLTHNSPLTPGREPTRGQGSDAWRSWQRALVQVLGDYLQRILSKC
jgi:hypothetical protein